MLRDKEMKAVGLSNRVDTDPALPPLMNVHTADIYSLIGQHVTCVRTIVASPRVRSMGRTYDG
jgi:hypothetical protein